MICTYLSSSYPNSQATFFYQLFINAFLTTHLSFHCLSNNFVCQDSTEGNGNESYKKASWMDCLCYSPIGNENEIIFMGGILVAVQEFYSDYGMAFGKCFQFR